ncbi:MAG: glycosyltransferase family 4 protein [Campylobacterales bacterium]
MKRRILIVSHGAALGGSPISALQIGKYIERERFQLYYLFGEEGPIVEEVAKLGYPVEVLRKEGGRFKLFWRTLQLLKREGIELLHLNTLTPYYKYPALAGKALQLPILWMVREDPESRRSRRLYPYLRRLADKIVPVSHDTALHLPPEIPLSKIEILHNGINPHFCAGWSRERGLELLGLPGKYRYFSTIASLEPRKGVLELVEGFLGANLPENYRLLIAGRDPSPSQHYLSRLLKIIRGAEGRVLYLGEQRDVRPVLAVSDLFILYSQWEGLARTILEAMACRKPILASDRGGNREQVEHNFNGWLVPFGEIGELSRQLEGIVGANLEEIGEKSYRLLLERFQIGTQTRQLERLYLQLLDGSRDG